MLLKTTFFWFRRDLRLDDNIALYNALKSEKKVIPLFIFDETIIDKLEKNDARLTFIYESLEKINQNLKNIGSSVLIKKGKPLSVWQNIAKEFNVEKVFFNKDYEPSALKRDEEINIFFKENNIECFFYKDQVVFEENEIVKNDGLPYTVYTPYKNKWLEKFQTIYPLKQYECENLFQNFCKSNFYFPTLQEIGFEKSTIKVLPHNLKQIVNYHKNRDFPALDATSYLSPHLRFGTVSVRKLVNWSIHKNKIFLNELIWREFFMQILFHFPQSATQNFKANYNGIVWRNNKNDFKLWCNGNTGYSLVDAGMRQLNKTGYMHNRVRMVVASFLCKHLLIDWQWGERYFAQKLLDYDLSANVGNWQWASGTGCDAAPYFRVFNPSIQLKKFDSKGIYIRKWIPEFDSGYQSPIIEHDFARKRALDTYKQGILEKK